MKTPPAVTGRPSADSHAAYITAPWVKGRITRLTIKAAPSDSRNGVKAAKSVCPVSPTTDASEAKTSPTRAAEGIARMTEIPANKRK